MLKAQGKIIKSSGNTLYLTIPAGVAIDSQFPFKPGDFVELEITHVVEGNELIARPIAHVVDKNSPQRKDEEVKKLGIRKKP